MKLLLVAPWCDGEDVGESWAAYQWVRRLGQRHEVTLLAYYKSGHTPVGRQLSGIRVVEWAEPAFMNRVERLNSMLKPAYAAFYIRARRWIKSALAAGERFDLAHQLVPLAMRYPCPATGLGLPTIVGPVGGSLESPPAFDADGDSAPWYVGLRSLDRLRIHRDPWLARTYDEACCVLGIAPYVEEFLSPRNIRRFEVMCDAGIERLPALGATTEADLAPRTVPKGPIRLLYVGRVVRTKGLRDALRALARLPTATPVTFDVVGDGFDRPVCEALVEDLGLKSQVTFHGRLPRDEVDEFYRTADVFVFPSYREPGGHVVLEAMSWGLPLLVTDRGGPAAVVDDSCAIRVHPETPTQFAADLSVALTRLVETPALRTELGAGARKRVAEIALWDRKVERLEELYRQLLAEPESVSSST